MMKHVSILGSTGSIGRQSLDVISRMEGVEVTALTAGTSVERMEEQCRQFRPRLAVMATQAAAEDLARRLEDLPIRIAYGEEGLIQAATMEETDCVITAVVGMLGLKPTLAAIRAGKRIGLANKETLVCAGELVMAQAKQYNAQIIPVDSEHSAIFQCLMGNQDRGEVKKITIDCATLMNKGLEVIEAMRLYDLPLEQVQVLIHRQSIVHSMVEYVDGAVMAQMGAPDMRLPIQLALTYPQRMTCPVEPLDLTAAPLSFSHPDLEAFPCLALAMQAAKQGGTVCAVMNGANEEAVALYLDDKIGFYDIYELVRGAMDHVPPVADPTLDQILEADQAARNYVRSHAN